MQIAIAHRSSLRNPVWMTADDRHLEVASISAMARRLGISRRCLRQAVLDGELTASQPGTRTRYLIWSDVLCWLRNHRVPSSNHARERAIEIIAEENQKRTAAG